MDVSTEKETATSWIDRPLTEAAPRISLYTLAVVVILLLTAVSRFYHVDLRVMAHDEVNHVVPAYELYQGTATATIPLPTAPSSSTRWRCPTSFWVTATSRARAGGVVLHRHRGRRAAALPSLSGRSGALVAGVLFMISPFMLFYGRYVRNEAFVAFYGVVMLYSVLRYLTAATSFALSSYRNDGAAFRHQRDGLHLRAQLLIFLAVLFIRRPSSCPGRSRSGAGSSSLVLTAIAGLVLTLGFAVWNAS